VRRKTFKDKAAESIAKFVVAVYVVILVVAAVLFNIAVTVIIWSAIIGGIAFVLLSILNCLGIHLLH